MMQRTRFTIVKNGSSDTDVFDLSGDLAGELGRAGVETGLLLLFVPGSTAALTTIEYEPGVVQDLKEALERMVPRNIPYQHDRAWGDGNGYSHVRAALAGPSLAVPIEEGRLATGTWQQVVLLDFDNRPRRRTVNGYIYDAS